jgi:hypothetical protein
MYVCSVLPSLLLPTVSERFIWFLAAGLWAYPGTLPTTGAPCARGGSPQQVTIYFKRFRLNKVVLL